MRVSRTLTILAIVAAVGLACSDDNVTGIPAGLEVFTATLNGANERPDPTTTPATGSAIVTILGDRITWQVSVSNLSNVFIGHIHYGPVDSAGPIRQDLTPTTGTFTTDTVIARGSAIATAQLLADMRAGKSYVNIHTTDGAGAPDPVGPAGDYPGGEIRGQLVKQ